MNLETIIQLDDLRAHGAQIVRDRGDAVGFFDAQFLRLADSGRAAGERASHREDRQLIDQLRNFLPLDDGAFERRAGNLHRPARLDLIDILDRFADLRPHPNRTPSRPVRVSFKPACLTSRWPPGCAPAATSQNAAEEMSPGMVKSRDSGSLIAENADPAAVFL